MTYSTPHFTMPESLFVNIPDIPAPFSPMPSSIEKCQKQVSALLRALPRSQPIDSPMLRWLAEWSPKIGPQIGVSYFTIEDNWNNGYVTIAHLPDGSAIEFTYRDPVADFYRYTKKGNREDAAAHYARRLSTVMREAVRYQIEIWKEVHQGAGHVDHAFPLTFKSLVLQFRLELLAQERYGDSWEQFINDRSLEPAYIQLIDGGKENKYMNIFADDSVCRQWQAFHLQHARLRWLPVEFNPKFGDRDPALYGFHNLPDGTPIPS